MSQKTIKQRRREVRRAMGSEGLAAISELQESMAKIAQSLALAHQRIDQLQTKKDA